MKLSIIVPVYNVEQFLKKCLDSIIPQMDEDCELILVDDGSRDNSGKICDGYAANDIRINVLHQKNQGVSVARNEGLDLAKGEYVCFVDSDDYWNDGLLDIFRKNMKGDMIAYGYKSYPLLNTKDSHYFEYTSSFSHIELSKVILTMKIDFLLFPLFNKFYRRKIIVDNNISLVENIHYYEDLLFNLEFLKHVDCITTLVGCFYNYVQHPGERLGSKYTEPSVIIEVSNIILQRSLALGFDNRNRVFDYCFYYNCLMHAIDESYKKKNDNTRKYIELLSSKIKDNGYKEDFKQFVGRRRVFYVFNSKVWYYCILILNNLARK